MSLIFFLSFLGSLFLLNIFSHTVRGLFFDSIFSVQSFAWGVGMGWSDAMEGIIHGPSLQKRNLVLEGQLVAVIQALAELQGVKKENAELRKALDLGIQKEFALVAADIVAKEPMREIIMINRGSAHGLKKGMAAITSSKVAVGTIMETYASSSKILLLSDKESSVDAAISQKDAVGVLKGKGRSFFLDVIPRDKDVVPGDMVVTSHLGTVFPPNLLIGRISNVEKSDSDAFQKAMLEPFFDSASHASVFVITNQ